MSNATTTQIRNFNAVLSGLGVSQGAEIIAALGIGNDLGQIEDLTLLAAGERQRLGDLLQTAQRLTRDQLEDALAEQRQNGKKIGRILVDRGLISAAESEVVLAFQQSQSNHSPAVANKLHLGNVLVAIGAITHDQLAHALQWQSVNGGRLGEALVGAGFVREQQISNGLQLQRKLVAAVMLTALAMAAAFSPGTAHASNTMAGVQVSAVVRPSVQLSTNFQATHIKVTAEDIARGYVDMPGASRFSVVTPKGGNYFVDFHVRSELFQSVNVDGLGSQIEFGTDGGTVAQTGPGLKGATSTLSYRFRLNAHVQAGDYDWPLMLAVRAR